MNFRTATERLTTAVTHGDIAEALGVSVQTIRQARLDDASASYRTPPVAWRKAVATLARRRSKALLALAADMERE